MTTRSMALCFTALSFLLVLGCNKTNTPDSSSPASAPSNATNSAGSASGQSANNVPAAPPPVTAAPAPSPAATPAPPAPEAAPIVIPRGTVLTVTIDQSVSTKDNSAGDRFAASLAEPLTVDGAEPLPSGTKASGTVTQAQSAGHLKGGAMLALTLDSLTVHGKKYSIETSSFEEEGKGRGKRTAVGAGGGAAFGAIIGALAGGGKGAAIGAVAGGGAGTAGTAFTGKRDFTVPAETRLHFKLVKSLKISR